MYCNVILFVLMVLHYIVLYCNNALRCVALSCVVLHCFGFIALCCIVLHCVLCCISLRCILLCVVFCVALHFALRCILRCVAFCVALHFALRYMHCIAIKFCCKPFTTAYRLFHPLPPYRRSMALGQWQMLIATGPCDASGRVIGELKWSPDSCWLVSTSTIA